MNTDKLFFVVQNTIKYIPFNWGIKLRSLLYSPFFKKFGKNIQIKDGVTFKYPSDISIGDNTVVGEFCYFVGKSGLNIQKNTLIAAGCKVITSNHVHQNIEIPIIQQELTFQPVTISENCWLGFDVKVLAGSYISSGSIIAANSVVNGALKTKNSIYAGSPAKLKKSR